MGKHPLCRYANMGIYINRDNMSFVGARRGEYVDKSELILYINSTLNTESRMTCVSRARRFGKSMAAEMLYAYYDKSCDSRKLFEDLKVANPDNPINKNPETAFETHLNKYPTIYIDVTDFTSTYHDNKDIIKIFSRTIKKDIRETYPDIAISPRTDLMGTLVKVYEHTGEQFILIIDEWDAILREMGTDDDIVTEYVDLLRRLFKGSNSNSVFAGAYLTGILPIKRYNTESALNNFCEYTMIRPGKMSEALGFTHEEVVALCRKHNMSITEMESWYDGYRIGKATRMFNPYSVMKAIDNEEYGSYWTTTGAYDSVKTYIQMNFDGLKDDIIRMLAGESVPVTTTKFQNDMRVINSRNDVLTVLIHLGYLAYDRDTNRCYIPNKEVAEEMSNAVQATEWSQLAKTLENSQHLLDSTIAGNEQTVAQAIDLAHDENTSILSYNDENSLACVLSMAYIWAKNEYIIHREYATGKGYADLVMIPRRNVSKPALVIELKFNHSADTAIDQIRQKNYPAQIAEYTGDILLVGISYDKESKQHACRIERYRK